MTLKNLVPWEWGSKHLPIRQEEERSIQSLHREMNRMIDDFFQGFSLNPFEDFDFENRFGNYSPRVNVTENDKEILVIAELPGLDEKDFEVDLSRDTLTIKGEKREERDDKEKGHYRLERTYGSFHRTIPMPCEVDEEKVEATFKKGVLKLRLPKTEEAKKAVKKITVKAG
jgi:HSP20 family protein